MTKIIRYYIQCWTFTNNRPVWRTTINLFYKCKRWKYWVRWTCKECDKKYHSNRYIEKKDIILHYNNEYNRNNSESKREYDNAYYKSEKWKIIKNLNNHKRRLKEKTLSDWSITYEVLDEILITQKSLCNICFISIKNRNERHIDHIIPLSKWWTHKIDNVQWLCCRCNLKKWNRV